MAYICSPIRGNGVWRSWLAHLVWDQRVLCSSHSTPTKKETFFNVSFFVGVLGVRSTPVLLCLGALPLLYPAAPPSVFAFGKYTAPAVALVREYVVVFWGVWSGDFS